MPSVLDVLCKKGSQVYTTSPDATVLHAASMMNQHHVGALLVVDEHGQLKGIFTERDALRRVVAMQADPSQTRIASVMSKDITTITAEASIDDARLLFMEERIRHLPVLDDRDELLGMISIGDINALMLEGQQAHIAYLQEYLYGSAG